MNSPVRRQNLGIDVGGIALLLILGAIFFFQFVRPWNERDQVNQAQRCQFLSLRQRAGNAAAQVRRLSQQLAAEQRSVPTSTAGREDVRRLNSRLSRIAALASKQGLQLRNVEPGKPTAEGDRILLPIHITGLADYRGCAQFLHALRIDFADMSVYSLNMTARLNGEKISVDFDMNLRWYAASALVSAQN